MRTPGIAGIAAIDCPSCGRPLQDYDAPEPLLGLTRLNARCHHCRTEQLLEIDHWRGETSVRSVSNSPWAEPAA
jgi:hypothetical protein